MPLAMKTSHYIFFILAAGINLSGCNDKECIKKDCIAGTYIMDIRVKMRPPIINYDFGRPDVIPYDHQIIYDEVMDTNQNTCCSVIFYPHDSSCFKNYTLSGEGIRIFEHDGQLYFKNGESYDINGVRYTFDVPLRQKDDSFFYEKSIDPPIGSFSRPSNNGLVNSTADSWPRGFDLIYLVIENKPGKTLKGRWVFKDLSETRCLVEMSNGESYRYRIGEIAEFTLTKVE